MYERCASLWACLSAVLFFAIEVPAQSPNLTAKLFENWDTNKNGILESSEIPASARDKLAQIAIREGIDFDQGIPIDDFLADDETKSKQPAIKAGKQIESDAVPGEEDNPIESRKLKSSEAKPKTLDPPENGFGGSAAAKRTEAFGTKKPATASASPKDSPSEKPKQEDNAAASPERDRLRFLAKAMLAQHDKNKNGQLEKKEWSRLRGNPEVSDRDKDSVLTIDEMADHLGGFAKRERPPRAAQSGRVLGGASESSTRKRYRFLTPHERLPNGLPDWFIDKDGNGDGQLSLFEYAARLSQKEADAFQILDLNNDGFIVAREYFRSTGSR